MCESGTILIWKIIIISLFFAIISGTDCDTGKNETLTMKKEISQLIEEMKFFKSVVEDKRELKLLIMSNKDQISKEKNETLIMKEEISQLIEEMKTLKSVVDENKELIEANRNKLKLCETEKKVNWTVNLSIL